MAPARGSMKWSQIYKERSAVERVNAYLKGCFLLNQIYHCMGMKAKLHVDLVHIAYNASKLAMDRLAHLQKFAA
jgi:transposase